MKYRPYPSLLSVCLLMTLPTLGARAAPPGSATAPASPSVVPGGRTAAPAGYRIGSEDTIEIVVVGQGDLSRTVTVRTDGKISYPYVGEMPVAGLTVGEFTRRLTAALNVQLVRPQVLVTVTPAKQEEPQVSVLGAVRTTGKHTLKAGWRVLDLIADSGGLAVDRPEWASATLIRAGTKTIPIDLARLLTTADPEQNPPLQAGDVLLVQQMDTSRTHVQVLGEVLKPGPVPVPPDGSLMTLLLAAGGPTPKAALSRATIVRGGVTIPVDLRGTLTEGKAATEGVRLEPGDMLVIPQNKQQFAVFGAVLRPGSQDYPEGERVTALSALSQSGGQSAEADLKNASLVRPSRDGKPSVVAVNLEDVLKKGDLSQDLPLQPGDVLYVPTRKQARGGFRIMDVFQYLPLVNLLYRR